MILTTMKMVAEIKKPYSTTKSTTAKFKTPWQISFENRWTIFTISALVFRGNLQNSVLTMLCSCTKVISKQSVWKMWRICEWFCTNRFL